MQDTITNFINLRQEYPTLATIGLRLPFGMRKKWDSFRIRNNLVYEPYIDDDLSLRDRQSVYSDHHSIFPMILEHKVLPKGKKVLLLKQQFNTWVPSNKRKGKLLFDVEARVSKKTGYYYRWTKAGDFITISKMIGTTKESQIKKQATELVKECQRFVFCYCQG